MTRVVNTFAIFVNTFGFFVDTKKVGRWSRVRPTPKKSWEGCQLFSKFVVTPKKSVVIVAPSTPKSFLHTLLYFCCGTNKKQVHEL